MIIYQRFYLLNGYHTIVELCGTPWSATGAEGVPFESGGNLDTIKGCGNDNFFKFLCTANAYQQPRRGLLYNNHEEDYYTTPPPLTKGAYFAYFTTTLSSHIGIARYALYAKTTNSTPMYIIYEFDFVVLPPIPVCPLPSSVMPCPQRRLHFESSWSSK